MARTESDFCHRQAERMHALARQCIDPKIRHQVEAMAKAWTDREAAEASPMPNLFIL